jgi:hypothetical protein
VHPATLDLSDLGLGTHELGSNAAKAQAIGKILPQVKYLPLDSANLSSWKYRGAQESTACRTT